MNATTMDAAIREARRFLDRARKVKADENAVKFNGCAKTAALRRASMDLTRALAELRKAN